MPPSKLGCRWRGLWSGRKKTTKFFFRLSMQDLRCSPSPTRYAASSLRTGGGVLATRLAVPRTFAPTAHRYSSKAWSICKKVLSISRLFEYLMQLHQQSRLPFGMKSLARRGSQFDVRNRAVSCLSLLVVLPAAIAFSVEVEAILRALAYGWGISMWASEGVVLDGKQLIAALQLKATTQWHRELLLHLSACLYDRKGSVARHNHMHTLPEQDLAADTFSLANGVFCALACCLSDECVTRPLDRVYEDGMRNVLNFQSSLDAQLISTLMQSRGPRLWP